MNTNPIKLLLALDGSENALNSVRYVTTLFSPGSAHIVLFHVEIDIPEIFWDMGREPALNFQTRDVQAWLIEHRKSIREYMENARQMLLQKGFSDDSIEVKIQPRHSGIARDIVRESQAGYSTVITGRKGLSRIKDFLVGNVTCKLVGRLQHTPLIIVGEKTESKRVMIAFDGSHGSKKAVEHAGLLLGNSGCEILLCHVIRSIQFSSAVPKPVTRAMTHAEAEWYAYSRSIIQPELETAKAMLMDYGFTLDRISTMVLIDSGSRARTLINHARSDGIDTIVLGRRGLTALEEFIAGSVSKKVFQGAADKTVWLVT